MKRQNEIQQRRDEIEKQSSVKGFARAELVVRTRWGEPPDITIHQVTDDELDRLIHSPESHNLTAAVSLLSASLAFGLPLFSSVLSYRSVFIALACLSFGAGSALLMIWLRERNSALETINNIRARLKALPMLQD